MHKEKSKRNKTIVLTEKEQSEYLSRCISDINGSVINKTIQGDTFEILNQLPSNFVDLLIVDPPYNLSKIYADNKFRKMSTYEYKTYTQKWLDNIYHTLKETASIYVCCDWETSLIIGDILGEYFKIKNRITWQREKGRGALTNWKNSMEDIWYATVSNDYTFNVDAVKQRRKVIAPYKVDGKPKDWEETENGNFRDTYPSNFWDDISIPYWSMPENTSHSTQKPEKLIAKLILASSNKGDVVLDPFLGSGTTSVVSKKLDRNYVGIEYEAEYCALAEKRLEMADTDQSIQGYVDGVFWERNTLSEQKKARKG